MIQCPRCANEVIRCSRCNIVLEAEFVYCFENKGEHICGWCMTDETDTNQ